MLGEAREEMGGAGLEWNGGKVKLGSVGGRHGLSVGALHGDWLGGWLAVEAWAVDHEEMPGGASVNDGGVGWGKTRWQLTGVVGKVVD